MLNNPQKVSLNLLSQSDVERLTVDGMALLSITVPRADRRSRPVYIKGNLLTGTYRRNFEGDYKCTEEQIRRMVAEADDRPRDGEILEHLAGSGLPRIRHAWNEQHWRQPEISENDTKSITTLELSMLNLMPDEAVDYFEKNLPGFHDLPDNQRMILLMTYVDKAVTHKSLRQVIGGHSRDLTLDLQALLRKGYLERIGHGRGCSYQLPVRIIQDTLQDDAEILQDTLQDDAEILQDTYREFHVKTKGSRKSVSVVRTEILRFCQGEYRTKAEIAEEIDLHPVYLGTKHLRPMVREGLLEYLHPDRPTHREQAYRTVADSEENR
jgi:predicted HTH transcriptional regulator